MRYSSIPIGTDRAQREGSATAGARLPAGPNAYGEVARALELAEPGGFSKALLAPDPGRIPGASVLGIEGGELDPAARHDWAL